MQLVLLFLPCVPMTFIYDLDPNRRKCFVTGDPSGFSPEQAMLITDKHNELRRYQPATNMVKMVWDPMLAESAQMAAATCQYKHTNQSERNSGMYGYLGENILATGEDHFMAPSIPQRWYQEEPDYNWANRTCINGTKCFHYTQVIWSNTHAVGCGVKYCGDDVGGINGFYNETTGENFRGYLVFCHYGPAGNVLEQDPYERGVKCSNCPSRFPICDEGLCKAGVTTNIVNANKHCELHRGPASYICLDPYFYRHEMAEGDKVCHKIFCSADEYTAACGPVRSVDGIVCGVGKVCKNFKCIDDESGETNTRRSGCIFGDQKVVYDLRNGGSMTCGEYVEKNGMSSCRDDRFLQKCCATCKEHMEIGDCPFGDDPHVAQACAAVNVLHLDWLCRSKWKDLCCGTCKRFKASGGSANLMSQMAMDMNSGQSHSSMGHGNH